MRFPVEAQSVGRRKTPEIGASDEATEGVGPGLCLGKEFQLLVSKLRVT